MLKIGTYLIILAVALVSVIIVVSVVRGDAILTTLQFALVLTVAAIPVAMPHRPVRDDGGWCAIAGRRRRPSSSRLVAIEELAGVDILCTDKTGTLTQNTLTLGDPFAVDDLPVEQVILDAALASRADDADTIDLAVLGGLASEDALAAYQVADFQPFDPVGKRTEAHIIAADGTSFTGDQGRPSGDPRAVGERRVGTGRRRRGRQRVRRAGLSFARRGPGGGR